MATPAGYGECGREERTVNKEASFFTGTKGGFFYS